MKKLVALTVTAVALALGASQAIAATSLTYYSFTITPDHFNTSVYSNNSFSVSDGTVVINGWQTCGSTGTANNYYYLVKKGTLIDEKYGTINVSGNIPQSGTWYTKEFTGVPTSSAYWVKVGTGVNCTNTGAGNAY